MDINVTLDGEPLLNWKGDGDDIARIDERVARISQREGYTVEQAAHTALRTLKQDRSLIENETKFRGAMMVIMLMLLSQQSTHGDHPGRIRDYVDVYNLDFDITITTDDKIGIATKASPPSPGRHEGRAPSPKLARARGRRRRLAPAP
jgi:hypothetical protein